MPPLLRWYGKRRGQFKLVSGAEYLEQNSGLFDAAFAGM